MLYEVITLNESERALLAFEAAAQVDPTSEEVLFQTGVTLSKLGRYDEAAESLGACSEINPEHPDAWYELA